MTKSALRLLGLIAFMSVLTLWAWADDIIVRYREGAFARFGISAAEAGKRAMTFAYSAPADIPRSEAFTDHRTMEVVGGVMFTAIASPAEGLTACPRVEIEATGPDGDRLLATFGKKHFEVASTIGS